MKRIQMKQHGIKMCLLLVAMVLGTSCASKKELVYFQDLEQQQVLDSVRAIEPTLQTGDFITIQVSSIDPVGAATFNLYETSEYNSYPRPISYLVKSDGTIGFPVLGDLQVKGLTTKALTTKVTEELKAYLKKPIVTVRITNFKIMVMGEVNKPGAYQVPNERITIVEALCMAGDLNIQAKRDNVLLIREEAGQRKFISIDLTNKKLFNSPYYYLAQNDVLYVEPNKTKINSSAVGANAGIIISSISTLISLIAIFTR